MLMKAGYMCLSLRTCAWVTKALLVCIKHIDLACMSKLVDRQSSSVVGWGVYNCMHMYFNDLDYSAL